MRQFAILILLGASVGGASTIDATITGTCGFYSGSVSNVVYSEPFTGNGTFCTGFASGGGISFTGSVETGDFSASAAHSINGTAPAGYGAFLNVNIELNTITQYVITGTSSNPIGSGDGSLTGFEQFQAVEDGIQSGICQQTAAVSLAGASSIGTVQSLPFTFGQPITVSETAQFDCNIYGEALGDAGNFLAFLSPLLVSDAQGNLLGPPDLVEIPETSSLPLISLGAVCMAVSRLLMNRRRSK